MALAFTELQTEVFARGFAYLNDAGAGLTRVKRAINDAMHDIDDMDRWDYRRATTTGTSPVTVSDLGEIDRVVDLTNLNRLVPSTLGEILDTYGEVATTGTAQLFYLNAGAVTAYPVTTATLTVRYFKVGPDLSSGSDAPLMPDRFRSSIVERACAYLYRDQDDPQMSAVCLAESDRIVSRMAEVEALKTGGRHQVVLGHSQDW